MNENVTGGTVWNTEEGLTLRDYFAGQALIGLMTNPELLGLVIKEQNKGYPDRMERFAFEVADAMIKEHNKMKK